MIRSFISALYLVASTVLCQATERTLFVNYAGDGTFRLQRIEFPFVLDETLGGFIGDAVRLGTGSYRFQLIPESKRKYEMLYLDIAIDGDGKVSLQESRAQLASQLLADQRVAVARAPVTLTERGDVVALDVTIPSVPARKITLPPLIKATNWSMKISGLRRIAVEVQTEPSNAELWVDEVKYPEGTSTSFVITVDESSPFSSHNILVRKRGYANEILRIDDDQNEAKFSLVLKRAFEQ